MDKKMVKRYNMKFNLTKEADARAWNYLHERDTKQYKTESDALIAAVNSFFGQKEPVAAAGAGIDSDQLRKILREELPDALISGLQKLIMGDYQPISQPKSEKAQESVRKETLSKVALDFMNSF